MKNLKEIMAHILLIDDDNKLRTLIRRILENAGHEVAEAANGRIGLDMQRESPADLIITDIFMPEKEGTEFIMDIGAEFPKAKVIVMSGGGNVADVDFLKLAENLGALRTFQKPFDHKKLLAAVKELVD
jgi:DNA-binding NtrC family response regulator